MPAENADAVLQRVTKELSGCHDGLYVTTQRAMEALGTSSTIRAALGSLMQPGFLLDDRQDEFALLDGADSIDVQDLVSTMTPLLLKLMEESKPGLHLWYVF